MCIIYLKIFKSLITFLFINILFNNKMMKQIFGSHRFHFGGGCTWTDFLGGDHPSLQKNKQTLQPPRIACTHQKK